MASADLHLSPVLRCLAHGGHDIPEENIRERWTSNRESLVRLLPFIDHLRVFKNSHESDPAEGCKLRLVLLLEMKPGEITPPPPIFPERLTGPSDHRGSHLLAHQTRVAREGVKGSPPPEEQDLDLRSPKSLLAGSELGDFCSLEPQSTHQSLLPEEEGVNSFLESGG